MQAFPNDSAQPLKIKIMTKDDSMCPNIEHNFLYYELCSKRIIFSDIDIPSNA